MSGKLPILTNLPLEVAWDFFDKMEFYDVVDLLKVDKQHAALVMAYIDHQHRLLFGSAEKSLNLKIRDITTKFLLDKLQPISQFLRDYRKGSSFARYFRPDEEEFPIINADQLRHINRIYNGGWQKANPAQGEMARYLSIQEIINRQPHPPFWPAEGFMGFRTFDEALEWHNQNRDLVASKSIIDQCKEKTFGSQHRYSNMLAQPPSELFKFQQLGFDYGFLEPEASVKVMKGYADVIDCIKHHFKISDVNTNILREFSRRKAPKINTRPWSYRVGEGIVFLSRRGKSIVVSQYDFNYPNEKFPYHHISNVILKSGNKILYYYPDEVYVVPPDFVEVGLQR